MMVLLKNLENIQDEYNIHIMLNTYHLPNDMLPWRHNKLLSRLFNTPIYADNIFLVLSEYEVNNGIQDVTEDKHLDFIDKFDEICNALILPHEEYLNKLNIFIDNDTVVAFGTSTITADPEASTWTAGVKVEKLIDKGAVQIVPRQNIWEKLSIKKVWNIWDNLC